MHPSLSAALRAAGILAAVWLGHAAPATAQTAEEVHAYTAWAQQVHAIVNDATDLIVATDALDQLSRQMAAGSLKPKDARKQAKRLIANFNSKLKAVKSHAAAQTAPPEYKDRTDMNNASKWLYAHLRETVAAADKILASSVETFEAAATGGKEIERSLSLKLSRQMIVLLSSENQANRAALFPLPRDPLHPQYHFLSILIESNEAMIAIYEAILTVGEGGDAAEAHTIMRDRIERARSAIDTLTDNGRKQAAVYMKLFDKGEQDGQIATSKADMLRQMFTTYDRSYEIENQIIATMAAYAALPNLAAQTDAHTKQAREILDRITPLGGERTRLQAQRTELAGKI